MQYTGYECPVCSEKFGEKDDIVVCPVCGTPHHRDCWRNNDGCKNEEKHNDGFVWLTPEMARIAPSQNQNESKNIKICPRCGEHNAPFEPVCTKCGERLKANRQTITDQMPDFHRQPFSGYGENPNPNNFSPYQNVYAADARTLYGPDAKIDDVPVTEVAEFVQKNSNKYIGDFLDMQEKNTKLKWNWSAAVFSVFWVFYRRMTMIGFALIALLFSISLISADITFAVYEKYRPEVYEAYEESAAELNKMMSEAVSGGMQSIPDNYTAAVMSLFFSPMIMTANIARIGCYLIIAVISGFFGNYFYKKKIIKDIHALRQVAVDGMSYHMYIRQRGGVSYANVLLPILCYMVLNMIMSYL